MLISMTFLLFTFQFETLELPEERPPRNRGFHRKGSVSLTPSTHSAFSSVSSSSKHSGDDESASKASSQNSFRTGNEKFTKTSSNTKGNSSKQKDLNETLVTKPEVGVKERKGMTHSWSSSVLEKYGIIPLGEGGKKTKMANSGEGVEDLFTRSADYGSAYHRNLRLEQMLEGKISRSRPSSKAEKRKMNEKSEALEKSGRISSLNVEPHSSHGKTNPIRKSQVMTPSSFTSKNNGKTSDIFTVPEGIHTDVKVKHMSDAKGNDSFGSDGGLNGDSQDSMEYDITKTMEKTPQVNLRRDAVSNTAKQSQLVYDASKVNSTSHDESSRGQSPSRTLNSIHDSHWPSNLGQGHNPHKYGGQKGQTPREEPSNGVNVINENKSVQTSNSSDSNISSEISDVFLHSGAFGSSKETSGSTEVHRKVLPLSYSLVDIVVVLQRLVEFSRTLCQMVAPLPVNQGGARHLETAHRIQEQIETLVRARTEIFDKIAQVSKIKQLIILCHMFVIIFLLIYLSYQYNYRGTL